ncbi:MAG: AfsR/SARP family transcriptional regulator, partial [Nitriliruptorales bacterium]|nr:AfsR/SARP family transcriptional regulator [Nitriliruptorales bacterium]
MTDTTDTVAIRLLGPVELAHDDDALGGPKQRLVLALLALHLGEVVTGERLADVVWNEDRPADPRRSLQVHVSKIRKAFDDVGLDASITYRSNGYILRTDPGSVDVHRFESLLSQALVILDDEPERAAATLREALSLWRGPLLGGASEHPLLVGETRRLEDLRLRAVEARIDADLARGRHADVTAELRRLTDRHPLRERFWEQLMLGLYRAGRQADALEAYERARRILRDELGVDPSPALQQLHARILDQDTGLDSPATIATR